MFGSHAFRGQDATLHREHHTGIFAGIFRSACGLSGNPREVTAMDYPGTGDCRLTYPRHHGRNVDRSYDFLLCSNNSRSLSTLPGAVHKPI
jgi:hypothetical protein